MTSSQSMRLAKPVEPDYVGLQHARYNGRDFYGEHAHDRAELTYLRDWKHWAEQELRGFEAFSRSVNEALNSGDGSYRS